MDLNSGASKKNTNRSVGLNSTQIKYCCLSSSTYLTLLLIQIIMDTKSIRSCFHLLCIVLTVSLLSYCSVKFSWNESTSMVDFRSYHESEKDIYPSISLCFNNMENPHGIYKTDTLNQTYGITDPSRYIELLEGDNWDTSLLHIDYDKVTMSLEDYIESISILANTHNGPAVYNWKANSNNIFPFRTTFRHSRAKCFSFDFSLDLIPEIRGTKKIPRKVRVFEINTKNLASLDIYMVYFAHYPNQLRRTSPLTVEAVKHAGVISGKLLKKYFWIDNLEVIRRRNTLNNPCVEDSKNWDHHVIAQMLEEEKCRPPHSKREDYPLCRNKESLQKLNPDFDSFYDPEIVDRFIKPCDEVQSVSYNIEEFMKTPNTSIDSTKILFLFKYGKYKDITHIRSFDVESLIGNMGGYVGLFLGFAIWQVPDAIELIIKMTKRIL